MNKLANKKITIIKTTKYKYTRITLRPLRVRVILKYYNNFILMWIGGSVASEHLDATRVICDTNILCNLRLVNPTT